MRNRLQRQTEIRKIIAKGNVHSQEEILKTLKIKGYELTQATLSRDLKYLQVAKIPNPVNGYVYVIPENNQNEDNSSDARINYLVDGVKGFQFSGNLAVMRTLPGYANSIAAVIDSSNIWEIIGTVAGDDTILVILREGVSKGDLMEALFSVIPGLKKKL